MTELCSVIYHYYASFWLGLEMRLWKSPMGFKLQSLSQLFEEYRDNIATETEGFSSKQQIKVN